MRNFHIFETVFRTVCILYTDQAISQKEAKPLGSDTLFVFSIWFQAPFKLPRFVMMRFCCIKATCSYYSVFARKWRGKRPFLCVHINLPDNKYGAKDIRFCALTLLPFSEAPCWILERFQNLRFIAFTLIKCSFKNLHVCGYPLLTAFLKTSVFVAFLCGSV